MKRFFSSFTLFFFLLLGFTQAQEYVDVAPGLNTLPDALEDEANIGKIFRLQRGGYYATDRVLIPADTVSCTIIGETEPADQRPAMIQRNINAGEATWEVILYGENTLHYKFENIGFYCYSHLGEQLLGAFDIVKSGGTLEINNCFFDGSNWASFFVEADGVDMKITNNVFMNSIGRTSFQQGHLYEGWGFVGTTAKIYNNTIVAFGGEGTGNGIRLDSLDINHNTFVLVDRLVSNDGWMGHINRIVENNIIVDALARGYVGPRPSWKEHPDSSVGYTGDNGDEGWSPSPIDSTEGIIRVDSLWTVLGDSTFLGTAEDERLVRVRNNMKYSTQLLKDFHAEITATTLPLFNNRTLQVFNDFANKINEGNMDEVADPNFVQGLPASAYQPFFKNTRERRNLGLRSAEYPVSETWNWGELSNVAEAYNLPWPISLDLKPQASEAGWGTATDGYPLGDLNWWGTDVREDWEVEKGLIVGVDDSYQIPTEFVLSQNYPNPFNPSTKIFYQIPQTASVSLVVYDITGQKIKTLVNENQQSTGVKEVIWNGTNDFGSKVSSGVYYYQLIVDNKFTDTKKMVLLK